MYIFRLILFPVPHFRNTRTGINKKDVKVKFIKNCFLTKLS